MKKWIALFLALILVLSLFGCAAKQEENQWEKFRKGPEDEKDGFVAFNKDIKDMKDPLVICMDVEFANEAPHQPDVILNDFLMSLEQSGGLSEVVINYLPKGDVEREMKLKRLRVEIMAGSGPDVFIMSCSTQWYDRLFAPAESPLFIFPEMSMENGLFLPLDEYMENNTRFAEWDKLTQPVLAAGRNNRDGQVIIPLAYTMPVHIYKKEDVDLDLTGASYTWDDMIHNPEIAPFAARFADCTEATLLDNGSTGTWRQTEYLPYILGQTANFKEEELSFTEEELLYYVNYMLDSAKTDIPVTEPPLSYSTSLCGNCTSEIAKELNGSVTDDITMIPMYTKDGGVSAMITAWAAINRNTDKPEEAFTVIDLLLSENTQRNQDIWEYFIEYGGDIPLHEDLLHPDKPFRNSDGFTFKNESHFEEFCEVRSQITEAQFRNPFTAEISYLIDRCYYGLNGINGGPEFGEFTSVEEEVHKTFEKMQRMLKE